MGIDETILAFTRGQVGPEELRSAGEVGLRRLLEALIGRPRVPIPHLDLGRDASDRIWEAISLLAADHPAAFLRALTQDERAWSAHKRRVVVSLRGVRSDDSTALLARLAVDPDWLIRLHAVRALGERSEHGAVQCTEAAAADEHPAVRLEAIGAIAKRAEAVGRDLLVRFADDAAVPPHYRAEARQLLAAL